VVISSDPSEVDAEVFSGTLCPLSALLFGGGRVPTSDPPASASRFPPLGGGDAPVVLPIPWATAAAAVVAAEATVAAAAEVASTMVVGLPDIACASQSKTRVSGVAANVGSRAKGDSPFYLCAHVTGATTITV
jgi:hypothetical protein